MDDPLYILMDA